MARFFFNTADGTREDDSVGAELPSLAAARIHALTFLSDLIAGEPTLLDDGHDFVVEVTDDQGLVLLTFTLMESSSPVVGYDRGR